MARATRADVVKATNAIRTFLLSKPVLAARQEAYESPEARRAFKANPRRFLAARGVRVPSGYRITVGGTVTICIQVCFVFRGVTICVQICGTIVF
jgi:hypothetical protein